MDEGLPYADDVPYEAQLLGSAEQAEAEQAGAASLKERIGNRIYLLEDSMSKKRKLVDIEEPGNADEHGDGDEEDADLPYRPNALLLQGPPIAQLPTARVFAYATHFDAHPIGLEWVDDQTCVLVFATRNNALQAWGALRKVSQSVDPITVQAGDSTAIQVEDINDDAFYPALPLPLALYPIEERINSVLGNKKSIALKETIQIRWARASDVKERGARVKSEFYKRHGEAAGKEGLPGFSHSSGHQTQNGNKRRRRDGGDEEARRQLDADLDVFLDGEEGQRSPPNLNSRVSRRRDEARRPEDRAQDQEEKRRILDSELDSFLAHGDSTERPFELTETDEGATPLDNVSRGPSLLDRTAQSLRGRDRQYKPLPRRDRRGGQDRNEPRYETDGDGRWLHNAEVKQRRRRDEYDEGGSGMRAWGGDETRHPKPRKTQEELDRELEHFGREAN